MATKILTDPFHDIKLYHRAPLHLLKGQLIDPGVGHRWTSRVAPRARSRPTGTSLRGCPPARLRRASSFMSLRRTPITADLVGMR